MNLTAYLITFFVIISSCTSATNTTKENSNAVAQAITYNNESNGDPEPPKRATFNMLATIRQDNSSINGIKITSTARGVYQVNFNDNTISIEMKSQIGNRNFVIKNYTKEKKKYNSGTVKTGLLYAGVDATNNEYTEIEYMFGEANDLQSLLIRAGGMVAELSNLHQTSKAYNENTKIIGCWWVPHNGGEAIRFNTDQTFIHNTFKKVNEKDELDFQTAEIIERGTYKFDGKTITLYHDSRKKETCQFYIEKKDGFSRIKREAKEGFYLYLKAEQCD